MSVEEREQALKDELSGRNKGQAEQALVEAREQVAAGYDLGFGLIDETDMGDHTVYKFVVADKERAALIEAHLSDTSRATMGYQTHLEQTSLEWVEDYLAKTLAGSIDRFKFDRYQVMVEQHPFYIPTRPA